MKRKLSTLILALCISLPLSHAALAADEQGGHDASMHEGMQHGMPMSSRAVYADTLTEEGVRAEAMLMDTSKAMAAAGMESTHHFMVNFFNDEDGSSMAEGKAAVKVTLPSGKQTEAINMMPMANGFGADLTLKEDGAYTFTVGTKLNDGQTRQFVFKTELQK